MFTIKNIFVVLCVAFVMSSCVSTYNQKSAPLWLSDVNSVYPEKEWITAIEYAHTKQQAQAQAVSSLAKIFRQDVKTETTAFQRYVDRVLNEDAGNKNVSFSESREYAQQVVTTSDVNSLIGVNVNDTWTAQDGTVYVLARMNRKEAALRYSSLIIENEHVVVSLLKMADSNPNTFDAYESLSFAYDIAVVNDNFLDILSVLDTNMAKIRSPSYGNATKIKQYMQDCLKNIVIAINIDGDIDERISKAFASSFSQQGFKTSVNNNEFSSYILDGKFQIQELDTGTNNNKFVRYILTVSLKNKSNVELISWTSNDRDGHLSFEEAKQRAIRTAEQNIKQNFYIIFDNYLNSLLLK